jgi:dolichol-phosphate mannosyltransferase
MECAEALPAMDGSTGRTPSVLPLDVSVIVPTYREAENLPVLVPRITAALGAAGLHGEIVIVDDDSPDDTAACCKELALGYPLRLLVRHSERGLSGAVLHGMCHAAGSVLVVMDADLSHPPETIPALVAAVREGQADFAIGSRYVAGGSTVETWGLWRRLNSRVATVLATPLTRARDPLAGFFAIPRSQFAMCGPFDPVGFKIGLELIVKCRCRHIREVPITFRDRRRGASKLTIREQLNYLRHLLRLYRYRWRNR